MADKLDGTVTMSLESFVALKEKADSTKLLADENHMMNGWIDQLRELAIRMAIDTTRICTRPLEECVDIGNDWSSCILNNKLISLRKQYIKDAEIIKVIKMVYAEEHSDPNVVYGKPLND